MDDIMTITFEEHPARGRCLQFKNDKCAKHYHGKLIVIPGVGASKAKWDKFNRSMGIVKDHGEISVSKARSIAKARGLTLFSASRFHADILSPV